MTSKELDNRIREIAPQWLINECDEYIYIGESEEWESPARDCIDCFNDWGGNDMSQTQQYKTAITKLERALGCQRKLKEGEQCTICTSSGSRRRLREGAWVWIQRFDQLITE